MGMRNVFLALSLVILLPGCAATLEPSAEIAIDKLQGIHDKQLVVGRLAMCGSSLRAIGQEFGGDIEKMWALLILCDQDRVVRDLVDFLESTSER